MSQRRGNGGTSAQEAPQQPTANYWNNGPAPTWMGPLAYYNNDNRNEDMEGRFRTGLSLTGGPGFNTQPSRQGSTPMEDSLFEINQTGLSPMWYDGHPSSFHTRSSSLLRRDPSPAYIDPRVGRPAMQARPPLPFQYVTEPPSVPMHTNTAPPTWETPPVDVRFRGRGRAPNTARQPALYQSLPGQLTPGEATPTGTPVPVSQAYPANPPNQYTPYPPYPGPLTLPAGYLPGPTAYPPLQQQEPTPVQAATSPGPILVQLGSSQNFLVNNRPARWIQVLDVDPSYQRARTPSPNRSPALSIYVRAPETEVHYWAVFLRDLTVQELIKRVVQKYGFSDDERDRVQRAVRVTTTTTTTTSSGGGNVGGGVGEGEVGDEGEGGEGEVERLLGDEDVRGMESEVAIDVKVTSLDVRSEDWQLELRY